MPPCRNCASSSARCSLANSRTVGQCSRCSTQGIPCERQITTNTIPASATPSAQVSKSARRPPRPAKASSVPPPPPPLASKLEEIRISLDTGTEYTKASYTLCFKNSETESHHSSFVVCWPDNSTTVRSQVAFTKSGKMAWGSEVDDMLNRQEIREDQVKRRFKPALFDHGDQPDTVTQDLMTNPLRARDEEALSESLRYYGEQVDDKKMESIVLYTDFMRLVYRQVLHFIAETNARLFWPRNIDDYDTFVPSVNIRVALPLPVASTQAQVQLVMAAARVAGIPNPYPVGEPSAALANYLQVTDENKVLGTSFLILDAGAGSIDQEAATLIGTSPLLVRESDIPREAKTVWAGGKFVNNAAVSLITKKIGDMDGFLKKMAQNGVSMTRSRFESILEEKFEIEKKRFSGSETLLLSIPGIPENAKFGMIGGNQVVLKPEEVQAVFAPCLKKIFFMIDTAIRAVSPSKMVRGWPRMTPHVNEILLAGGLCQNRYVRNQICARYSAATPPTGLYSIPVSRQTNSAESPVAVSNGSLLLLAEDELVRERIIRRGYCIAWNTELYPGKKYPVGCPLYSSHSDGIMRAANQSWFLVNAGQRITQHHESSIRGGRHLCLSELDDDQSGWSVEEILCYADKEEDDYIWVDDPGNSITRLPDTLKFKIPIGYAQHFPAPKRCPPPSQDAFYSIDYEVKIVIHGMLLSFEMMIPHFGRFSEGAEPGDVDAMDLQGQQTYNIAGVCKLGNTGLR